MSQHQTDRKKVVTQAELEHMLEVGWKENGRVRSRGIERVSLYRTRGRTGYQTRLLRVSL